MLMQNLSLLPIITNLPARYFKRKLKKRVVDKTSLSNLVKNYDLNTTHATLARKA